jgi:hypothetical protein
VGFYPIWFLWYNERTLLEERVMEVNILPRTNKFFYVEIDGVKNTLSGWSRELGISVDLLRRRYQRGKRGADLVKPSRTYKK